MSSLVEVFNDIATEVDGVKYVHSPTPAGLCVLLQCNGFGRAVGPHERMRSLYQSIGEQNGLMIVLCVGQISKLFSSISVVHSQHQF